MSDRVAEYLVSHGCTAALSRCRDAGAVFPARGDRVVIRSVRGLELGEVLCEAAANTGPISVGDILRRANAEDEAASCDLRRRGLGLLDHAQTLVARDRLPLLPLDADMLLDGTHAVVHVLRWDACTLTPLLEELRQRHGLHITLQDCSKQETAADHGCSSCGTGGCGDGGCGTGGGCANGDSCSRGAAHSAPELTAYFAQLREQMQAALPRVPLI